MRVAIRLESDPPPMAYYPYWQRPPDAVSLVVRSAAIRQTVASLASPSVPNRGILDGDARTLLTVSRAADCYSDRRALIG